jgi:hypothetical protein
MPYNPEPRAIMKRLDLLRRKLLLQGLHGAAILGTARVADASQLFRGGGALAPQSTGIAAAGLLNVKDYGAAGDGTIDDTAAILAAIAALPSYSAAHNGIANIIYFPVGTYKISDTIQRIGEVVGTSNGKLANLILLGADRDTTIIKLADNAPGFTSSKSPKSMIAMHSGDYYFQSSGDGEGNEAFNNTLENLTVSAGTGNAGARAIDWVVNNYGVIRNVKVLTTGAAACGIYMVRREVGPGLISNVSVRGPFDVGVDLACSELSVTMEHISITGTTGVGLRNSQNVYCLRNVTITTNSGIGVQQIEGGADITTPWGPNEGLIVWQDGVITGNGSAAFSGNFGYFNFSNVHVVNFNSSTNQTLDGVWTKTVKIGDPDWRLTVKDTPTLPGLPDSSWGLIVAPLAPADATSALQSALNGATATQLFLPNGIYKVSGPIKIPDHITCIDFLYSDFQLVVSRSYDLFTTNPTRTADLFLKRLIVENSGTGIYAVVHHYAPSPSRLIVTDFASPNLVIRETMAGEVYVENCNSAHFVVKGGSAGIWMRQFNPEGSTTKVSNVTAPMWILGFKTESGSIAIDNDSGNVEVLGGLHLAGSAVGSTPKFNNYNGGRISAAYVNEDLSPGIGYTNEMVSVIGGVINIILTARFPQRGAYNGRVVYKISTDDFIPIISFTPPLIRPSTGIATPIATASLTGYHYTGNPVWALSDNASGKYAINSSTGGVTVAATLGAGTDHITIAVSGVTPSGVVSLIAAIHVTDSN